jgi:phosphatidylglycerol:prolipoprotein diacylglycerol transferase
VSLGEFFNALGYLVGGFVFWLALKARGTATSGFALVLCAGFVFAVLGAKLTQLLFEGWPFTIPVEAALDPRTGGRALAGGLIFGWIGVEVAKRRLGIKRSSGDQFALALCAGEAVGRIGCYFSGCCYGTISELPLAVEQHGALRHPAQLYSAAVAALMLGVLVLVKAHFGSSLREGALFKVYLLLFATSRFGLEFVRQRDSVWVGLSPMQWFCLELVVGVAVMIVLSRRTARREPA